MKKVVTFIVAVLSVLFMSVPFTGTAEAAWVAVVPIQIDDEQVERAGDFNSYYWDMMIDRFKYPEYELLEEEKVEAAVPEEGLNNYDQATLVKIADQTDADIVVAMRLDKVDEKGLNGRREATLECTMKGQFISYNRMTGKFYNKKINYKEEIEEVLTVRNDWQQEAFADFVRRGINRTLEDKKRKSGKNF